MKFTATIALLSLLLGSEAMESATNQSTGPLVSKMDYDSDRMACHYWLSNGNHTWSVYQAKKCLTAFVQCNRTDLLQRIFAEVVPAKVVGRGERLQVEKHLEDLLVTASLDNHVDCLYLLSSKVPSVSNATLFRAFVRAAGSGSYRAVDFWIERMRHIPTDIGTEAISEALAAGEELMARKLVNSPFVTYDKTNHAVNKLLWKIYDEQNQQHVPAVVQSAAQQPSDQVYNQDQEPSVLDMDEGGTPETIVEEKKKDEPEIEEIQSTPMAEAKVPISLAESSSGKDKDKSTPLNTKEEQTATREQVPQPKKSVSKPTSQVAAQQPAEESWWRGISRMVSNVYYHGSIFGDEDWILPEETWDSVYGPRHYSYSDNY